VASQQLPSGLPAASCRDRFWRAHGELFEELIGNLYLEKRAHLELYLEIENTKFFCTQSVTTSLIVGLQEIWEITLKTLDLNSISLY
jgi:hypothetical protein